MADFHQNGSVATMHNLSLVSLQEIERQLETFTSGRKITLILPSLFSEIKGPALAKIVDVLSEVKYINHIIIGLDQASEAEFAFARNYFSRLPQKHDILWNDGPRLREIDSELSDANLAPSEAGKGRNVWYCMGYAIACQNSDIIALHDCDIVTYSREMLARLLYPVSNPAFPYLFCKGYYPRVADGKLNGRVTRLLVTPLLLALQKTCGHHDYLDYLQGFRYPLAGEFAMRTSILSDIRIPSDWGLEIGVLSEVWRNLNNHAVCQVDISDAYDHKHQPLSKDDTTKGLSRMSTDISKALFRKLATDGVIFTQETFRTLKATYFRIALDLIEMYYNDALTNGLHVDRHVEEEAVELFASNIVEAGHLFLDNPMETPFIPNWRRVNAAYPDLLRNLEQAVLLDNE
ncbi:MAG: glucosyl-3-phosphoglycerate synthase [Polaribacter sp.]|jgi:glucosyl-3-phosphoglycerate synthase